MNLTQYDKLEERTQTGNCRKPTKNQNSMSGSELLIMSVISFLTRCRRSPGTWRLTGAAYLVISHGAIRRTASTSDCFAPCGIKPSSPRILCFQVIVKAKLLSNSTPSTQVLLYASLPWFRRIFGKSHGP
ncbi:hypothetical protein AMECASPLE_009971 [Ameca splendens]|uniref:Uncharacterized protein n=1 Tax=Ameca splendens TaxID=208324 RepID=A0ABV0YBA6_9TELE